MRDRQRCSFVKKENLNAATILKSQPCEWPFLAKVCGLFANLLAHNFVSIAPIYNVHLEIVN